jgi:ribosomal protein L31E
MMNQIQTPLKRIKGILAKKGSKEMMNQIQTYAQHHMHTEDKIHHAYLQASTLTHRTLL